MKKTFKLIGIIALFAVIGFSMVACGDGSDSSAPSLEGRWVNSWNEGGRRYYLSYSFSGSNFTCFSFLGSGAYYIYTGTFSRTATAITFTSSEKGTWTQNYTLSKDELYLEQDVANNFSGLFIKQLQFMIIESIDYNNATKQSTWDALLAKHLKGMTFVSPVQPVLDSYWNDMAPVISEEMRKKMPAVGLVIVMKVDTYKAIGFYSWEPDGSWNGSNIMMYYK